MFHFNFYLKKYVMQKWFENEFNLTWNIYSQFITWQFTIHNLNENCIIISKWLLILVGLSIGKSYILKLFSFLPHNMRQLLKNQTKYFEKLSVPTLKATNRVYDTLNIRLINYYCTRTCVIKFILLPHLHKC